MQASISGGFFDAVLFVGGFNSITGGSSCRSSDATIHGGSHSDCIAELREGGERATKERRVRTQIILTWHFEQKREGKVKEEEGRRRIRIRIKVLEVKSRKHPQEVVENQRLLVAERKLKAKSEIQIRTRCAAT